MKILMVLTSHDRLGDTGRKTGFWLEELASPYYVFKDAGAEIVLVSPEGGRGLLIVGALARAWGTERLSAGKCVWFELDALPA